jgi:hypothetical protein
MPVTDMASSIARAAIPAPCCFSHARRKPLDLAGVVSSARKRSRGQRAPVIYPIALEAVQRLDALFDIERGIDGKSPAERLAVCLGTQRAADGRASHLAHRASCQAVAWP